MHRANTFFNLSLFIIVFLLIINSSCRHNTVIPDSPQISFENEVKPIIVGSCATPGCHSTNGEEFPLTNYDEIKKQVRAGDALNSRLYKAITSVGSGQMPPDQPLSESQLRVIYVWIMQGAKNN